MAKPKKPTPATKEETTDKPAVEVVHAEYLSVDLIDDPEQPMRTDLNPASCESLVMSIKQAGILEPLLVRPKNGRYEVIAGHRRLYSARLAKMVKVPCILREANDEETEMMKIHENLYREDIKPADEAKHFDYLIQKRNMSPQKIAQLISKSNGYVTDRLGILNYPPVLRDAMDKGIVSFSVAREFSRFDDEKQLRTAIYYSERSGMTHSMARKWVNDYFTQKNNPYGQSPASSEAPEPAQPVEHTISCVYCREGMRMIEAEVVYMHTHCLNQANSVLLENPPAAEPEA